MTAETRINKKATLTLDTVKEKAGHYRVILPVLAMTAFGSLASAQDNDVSKLASTATAGGDAVKSAVVTMAGVVVVIGLLVWASRHLKPKG